MGSTVSEHESNQERRRVAIINDNSVQALLLERILQQGGYEPMVFPSAVPALRAFADSAPDLIITDLRMPEINGWHLCYLLRRPGPNPLREIPILAVSASFHDAQSGVLASELGADAFLAVPVAPELLLQTVEQLLERRTLKPKQAVLLVQPREQGADDLSAAFLEDRTEVFRAESIEQARRHLRERKFSTVVVDRDLPEGQAEKFLEQLAQDHSDTVRVALSSSPDPSLALRSMECGAQFHFRRPLEPRYLVAVVRQLRKEKALREVLELLEQKNASLIESEARFHQLFDESFDPVLLLSGGCFIDCNRAAIQALELTTKEEILGQTPLSFSPPVQPDGKVSAEAMAEIQASIESSESLRFEWWYQTATGRPFPVETMATKIQLQGRPVQYLVLRDIRERKATESALQKAMQQLQLAVENANVGLWFWDLENNDVEYTDEWKKQLGYEPGEIGRGYDEWERRVHPEDRDGAIAYVENFLKGKGGERYQQEFRLRHKDGSYRRILAQGSLQRHPDGRVARLIGTHLDITNLKRLEEERVAIERELFHSQKLESLGVLAGGIAHDFNNLLMAMMGQLELVELDLPPNSHAREGVAETLKAIRRGSDLTRQLLVYSGKARYQIKAVDLNALVHDNVHLFRAAVPKRIRLVHDLAPALPPIQADPGQIQQVVMNLITNAAEAIGENPGEVKITSGSRLFSSEELVSSRLGNHPEPGDYIWLSVTDNGCGMNEVTQKRIFDPFFTTKRTGRGLGMSSALGIIRSHRGAVFVKSAPNDGTTLTILFPKSP
jgi:PAS domain S-box-containing protein